MTEGRGLCAGCQRPAQPRILPVMAKNVTKGNLWGYIQSRPYASVADIRRQFSLESEAAIPLRTGHGVVYIGLPNRDAQFLRQLLREGRIALDFLPDVRAHVVTGVYAIQPPSRKAAPGRPAKGKSTRKRNRRSRRGGRTTPTAPPTERPAATATDGNVSG